MSILKKFKAFPFHLVSVPGIVMIVATPGFATVYLTIEQAQQVIFPGQNLTPIEGTLKQKIWRTEDGGFFILDKVIGKHELITYALGINPDGSIRQIEIMDYREAYGYEIRQKRWRRQFVGKTATASLNLNEDIVNISGATLSCRHVTEGVKGIMNLYERMLKK